MHGISVRRAFLLVASLLITTILLIIGYGLMSTQSARYRGMARAVEAAQAFQLAQAGLEDVRFKLEADQDFPPHPATDQKVFNYAEDVFDNGQLIGSYEVSVDTFYDRPPWQLVQVTCTGTVGPKENPVSQRKFRADLRHVAGTSAATTTWGWVKFEDMGSL